MKTIFTLVCFFYCSFALGQNQAEWEAKWDAHDALEACEQAKGYALYSKDVMEDMRGQALTAKAECNDPLFLGAGNSHYNAGESKNTAGWQDYSLGGTPNHYNASVNMIAGDAAWSVGDYNDAANHYVIAEAFAGDAAQKYYAAMDDWVGNDGAYDAYEDAKETYIQGNNSSQ